MFIFILTTLCTIQIFSQQCCGVMFVDLPGFGSDENADTSDHDTDAAFKKEPEANYQRIERKKYPLVRARKPTPMVRRRLWPASPPPKNSQPVMRQMGADGDENLKSKIAVLVEQTLHDTELKVNSAKFDNENSVLYKMGVVLSMVKKSREVMNELFNVAVRHRDEWKALEQLKIFELIVHTNVDTTNYVRHLVELHIGYLNGTDQDDKKGTNRVVLL